MIRVVSLFAGVGGADLGLYAAARGLGVDVKVVAAYEIDAKAVEIYNANLPHATAVVADVKRLTRADLPPHDLVIGGAPCQPFSLAGKRRGADDPRDCLPDFVRLAGDGPWLMENVVPRLLPQTPFCVQLNAFDFGDVTTRKRWFYSNYLLHVIETPGPRRFGDIRDHEADRIALAKRGRRACVEKVQTYEALGTLTVGKGVVSGFLKVGMHQHGGREPVYDDGDALPSIQSQAWYGVNQMSEVRCPSLLEMQRAHSIPEDFEWCGATKTQRGRYIANSWPCKLAEAVCRAMLIAVGAAEKVA